MLSWLSQRRLGRAGRAVPGGARFGGVLLAGVLLTGVLLTTAGCSAPGSDPTSSTAAPSFTPSVATSGQVAGRPADDGGLQGTVFGTASPRSVDVYWRRHPAERPDTVSGPLLLDRFGRGPQTISLPAVSANARLSVVLTCGATAAYRVTAFSADAAEVFFTGGSSCGGPDLPAYTWPVGHGAVPRTIRIDVPAGTPHWLTIYTNPLRG